MPESRGSSPRVGLGRSFLSDFRYESLYLLQAGDAGLRVVRFRAREFLFADGPSPTVVYRSAFLHESLDISLGHIDDQSEIMPELRQLHLVGCWCPA